MLKNIFLYAISFAAFGAVYGLIKTAIAGDGVSVDTGLIVTLAVTGAIGGAIVTRRARR